MHQGGVGYHPPFQAPVLVSLAVEERSNNGVINFFSCSFVFSKSWLHSGFGLGQSELVPSARTYSAMLSWASVMARSCSGLRDTGSLLLYPFVTEMPSNRNAWAGLQVMVIRLLQGK